MRLSWTASWHIPQRIDAPQKVLIFGVGEFILLVTVFILGILFDFFLLGALGAIGVVVLMRMIKTRAEGLTLDIVLYWWFGATPKSLPPSWKRIWRG